MANYYEILKIPVTASEKEIRDALDEQYNYYRKLVTHHNPETVQKANQALISIEKIRTTFLDPKSREIYDEAIGIKSTNFGGLADPFSGLPNMPVAGSVPVNFSARSNPKGILECTKCGTQNPLGARHCKKCGNQLSIDCPNCRALIDVSAQYCISCGVNVRQFLANKKVEEESQSRQRELEEAERLKQHRQFERSRSEQASRLKVEQKKSSYKSCITISIMLFVCSCLAYFGGSTVLNAFNLSRIKSLPGAVSESIAQTSTAQQQESEIKSTYAPIWKGSTVQLQTWLYRSDDDYFSVGFSVANLTQSEIVVTFLTSDIMVTDNFGNKYELRSNTNPVRDTLEVASQYNGAKEYTLDYSGTIDPSVTALTVNFPSINGEQAATITVPLRLMDDQLVFTLQPNYYSDDSFSVRMEIKNESTAPFLLRFRSSDILISDDIGNIYALDDNYQNQQYASLIEGKDDYSSSYSDEWRFKPAISPRAKSITTAAQIMGKTFSQVINFEYPFDQIRYEATLVYESDNYFTVTFKSFNLGGGDFLLRFDSKDIKVQAADGSMYSARENQGTVMRSISSGNYQELNIYFDGTLINKDGLKLVIPVISAQENVQIEIKVNGQ
jgi:curved DNA-binding protein CbpA